MGEEKEFNLKDYEETLNVDGLIFDGKGEEEDSDDNQ